MAHIVPLHSDEGSLLEAAAVAWQPDPGLDVLRGGEAGLLPAAGEEEPGREQAISFGARGRALVASGRGGCGACSCCSPACAGARVVCAVLCTTRRVQQHRPACRRV